MNSAVSRRSVVWATPAVMASLPAPAYSTSTTPVCHVTGCKEPGTYRRKTYHVYVACNFRPQLVEIGGVAAEYDSTFGRWTLRNAPDSRTPIVVGVKTIAGTWVDVVDFKPCKEKK